MLKNSAFLVARAFSPRGAASKSSPFRLANHTIREFFSTLLVPRPYNTPVPGTPRFDTLASGCPVGASTQTGPMSGCDVVPA